MYTSGMRYEGPTHGSNHDEAYGLMASWRSSRIVRQAIRIPLIGSLPLGLFIRQRQRAARLYYLLQEYGERISDWWRSGRRLPTGLWSPRLLNLYFNPWVVLGRVSALPATGDETRPTSGRMHGSIPDHTEPAKERDRICIYVSSAGNFFHSEMAELIARGLQNSGLFQVERRSESHEPDDSSLDIVVAPHEFYGLGSGTRFQEDRYRWFREQSNLFLAEQPGSKHFAACLPFVAEAKRTFDINFQSTGLLLELGAEAHFLPVGYVEGQTTPDGEPDSLEEQVRSRGLSLDWAEADPNSLRPIDIAFTGVLTKRRAAFFSRYAEAFSRHRCVFALPTAAEPLGGSVSSTLTTQEATLLSQRSKILLNIHRNEAAYFEWHRIMIRGLWQQALVVSEPSPLPPGLKAGEHFMEAPLSEIPEMLDWILNSSDGRSKAESVRLAGHRFLLEHYDLVQWIKELGAVLKA